MINRESKRLDVWNFWFAGPQDPNRRNGKRIYWFGGSFLGSPSAWGAIWPCRGDFYSHYHESARTSKVFHCFRRFGFQKPKASALFRCPSRGPPRLWQQKLTIRAPRAKSGPLSINTDPDLLANSGLGGGGSGQVRIP